MSYEAKHLTMGLLLMFVILPMFTYLAFFEVIPAIHIWERDAGYPFGHMCEMYNTC